MAQLNEISTAAEADLRHIMRYTLNNFGLRQVQKYTKSILLCLDNLATGIQPYKEIDVEGHPVLIKRCQKHYIFALKEPKRLLVIAIFHEQMDLMQRLKDRLG
ncbi:MAG TPA: type II toxin-antitoxin system RelE/ParE family toxin [Saprospiraceae bacterium]|nr:type II toxin-antitoxin system RelE/ParE family toxin [Saprospiraceae bacterium]